MTVYKWDKAIAINNGTADAANINWQEGQSSDTVNNSARGMMQAIAKYRDDIAGTITTGGSSTAYTVTSNQGFTSLALLNGAMICFIPHATSGAGAITMQVDSLGFKPLRAVPSVELSTGQLVAGTPYAMTYINAANEFRLQGVPDLSGVTTAVIPIGGILAYGGSAAPSSNFALCFGQSLNTTTFAALFAVTSYAYGGGGASFLLPDLRGRVTAGKDDMGGSAAGVLTSSTMVPNATTLGALGGFQAHSIVAAELPPHTHAINITDPGHLHTVPFSGNVNVGASPGAAGFGGSTNTSSNTTGITATSSPNVQSALTPLVQPTILLNYIIRTL